MNYLKQALTELLSGLTTKKNEKEIWTKNKYGDGGFITVEPIDDENYIVRGYYEDDQLRWEEQYKNNQRHGFYRWWYGNGQLRLEKQYKNNQLYGVCKGWHRDGELAWEYRVK